MNPAPPVISSFILWLSQFERRLEVREGAGASVLPGDHTPPAAAPQIDRQVWIVKGDRPPALGAIVVAGLVGHQAPALKRHEAGEEPRRHIDLPAFGGIEHRGG